MSRSCTVGRRQSAADKPCRKSDQENVGRASLDPPPVPKLMPPRAKDPARLPPPFPFGFGPRPGVAGGPFPGPAAPFPAFGAPLGVAGGPDGGGPPGLAPLLPAAGRALENCGPALPLGSGAASAELSVERAKAV
eukprot:CAMPEP_0204299332 /NCGR_PEP_ID=MMETSP0468-20130131/76586_1 /ASSEMBLY_ACC=CAM_ASM_000383 /TAXON_ID=2969 /ORGANISM="Oxyrrhis marina" /LENGTH=134 /DNA_ID=CAMNT_0051278307 /DNA_START=66 /DNA_END=467 /DNA_ORIENTATION=+